LKVFLKFFWKLWKFLNERKKFQNFHVENSIHFKLLTISNLTLIGKSRKTHPENFLKCSFSGSSHRPFYWKTHPFFSKFQFWGVTQAVLLENASIQNHEYLFSFYQFWGVTQNVLLENSSIWFFWLKPYMIFNIWSGWVFQ